MTTDEEGYVQIDPSVVARITPDTSCEPYGIPRPEGVPHPLTVDIEEDANRVTLGPRGIKALHAFLSGVIERHGL